MTLTLTLTLTLTKACVGRRCLRPLPGLDAEVRVRVRVREP